MLRRGSLRWERVRGPPSQATARQPSLGAKADIAPPLGLQSNFYEAMDSSPISCLYQDSGIVNMEFGRTLGSWKENRPSFLSRTTDGVNSLRAEVSACHTPVRMELASVLKRAGPCLRPSSVDDPLEPDA